ncbi:hypothetical protein Dda_3933 [Drechslerella dactyloides]|uniref:Peptidase S8/S53 domain-containing protein n=1 Tax=Drechslerella dactyloides TaxID=74499 RepID=A0AAD6NKD1_DREDA|nr:hypothetical protein Dda_3933 [Drechslerella dactyloides]
MARLAEEFTDLTLDVISPIRKSAFKEFEYQQAANWIYAGPFSHDEKRDYDPPAKEIPEHLQGQSVDINQDGYHGTQVAAKAVGVRTGIAPDAELVLVMYESGRGHQHMGTLLDCLLKIYDHILDKAAEDDNFKGSGEVIPSTDFPQALKYEKRKPDDLKRFVVVGGLDMRTGENVYSKADFVKLLAPAIGVCIPKPAKSKSEIYFDGAGTSVDSRGYRIVITVNGDEKTDGDVRTSDALEEFQWITEQNPRGNHGSETAGVVVGKTVGVAPYADLVVVKQRNGRRGTLLSESLDLYLKIYDHIINDMKNKGRGWKGAVISSSVVNNYDIEIWGDTSTNARLVKAYTKEVLRLQLEVIKLFEKLGVYFVTVSGNGEPEEKIPRGWYPAAFKYDVDKPEDLKGFLIAGGVNSLTGENLYTEEPFVDFFAPVFPTCVPAPRASNSYIERIVGRTSHAAPLVAGLLATFMGQGEKSPVEKLKRLSYPRIEGWRPVVWNGIQRSQWSNPDGPPDQGGDQDTSPSQGGDSKDSRKKRPAEDPLDDGCRKNQKC